MACRMSHIRVLSEVALFLQLFFLEKKELSVAFLCLISMTD